MASRKEKVGRLNPDDARPRGLAGVYLNQALYQLHQTGDPNYLYGNDRLVSGIESAKPLLTAIADRRQIESSLTSLLFAALSAEAYVNEFLAYYLAGQDLQAVDRLRPVDKYVVGTRLALGQDLFERNKAPIPVLDELFRLRNNLVHPKPGYGPRDITEPYEPEKTFTPDNAAYFVISVAFAATLLVRTVREQELDFPADVIWFGREAIVRYANKASRSLPDFEAVPEPPLFRQALDEASGRARSPMHHAP